MGRRRAHSWGVGMNLRWARGSVWEEAPTPRHPCLRFPLGGQRNGHPRKGVRSGGGTAALGRCPLAPGPCPGDTAGGGSARSQARRTFPGCLQAHGAARAGPGCCARAAPGRSRRPLRALPLGPCCRRGFGGGQTDHKSVRSGQPKIGCHYGPGHTSTEKLPVLL